MRATIDGDGDVLVDVRGCQRCGGDHDDMQFDPFDNPADVYTHWGICPETGQPLLCKFDQNEADTGGPL